MACSSLAPLGHFVLIFLLVLNLPSSWSQPLAEVAHLGDNIGTVAVDGNRGVLNEGTTVRVMDLSDPSSPIFGGSVDVGAVPVSLTLIGDHAYGVAEFGNFFVIDISNPDAPMLLGAVDWEDMKRSLWVRPEEDFAYVAGCLGIHVVDISDPSSPTELTTVPLSTCPSSLKGAGDNLYVVNALGSHLLSIYSLLDPSSPTLMGQTPDRSVDTLGTYNSLEIIGDHAYLGHNSGIGIVDISTASAPVFVKTFSSGRRVLSRMGAQLVADTWQNEQVLNLTDPENPVIEKSISDYAVGEPFQTAVLAGEVFRAQTHSLYTTKVSSEETTETWSISPFFGGVSGLSQKGEFIFTGTQPGFASIDITDPLSPKVIQHIEDRYSLQLEVIGNFLYTLATQGILSVWDISNPYNMEKLLVEYTLAGGGGSARFSSSQDHLAISANQTFHLFNVAGDGSLTEQTRFEPAGGVDAVALLGDTAFMARLDGSLLVYNMTAPASPTFVQTIPVLTRQIQNGLGAVLQVEGNRLHMFVARAGYALLDISTPSTPSILGTFNEPEMEAFGLAVDGNTVYLATDGWLGHRGIRVLDISDPANIAQVVTFDATFRTRDLIVHGGQLFSTETLGGLRIRNLFSSPADPTVIPSSTATFTQLPTSTPYPTYTSVPPLPTHTPYPTYTEAPTCEPIITNASGDLTGDGEVGPKDILEILRFWKTPSK